MQKVLVSKEASLTESVNISSNFEAREPSASTDTDPGITLENLQTNQQLIELNPFYLPRDFPSLPKIFEENKFPETYRQNSTKEDRLLAYADNFYRQYSSRFPDRTPLLLTPKNELGVRKFVCTYIRPTKLPYPELHEASGIAKFVADFLQISPILPCNELPRRLLSPSTTLQLQIGTCFEYSTLLCSLLIGVGYNAYIVSGYATRECCFKDESRKQCPLLMEKIKKPQIYEPPKAGKYQVKPMKKFTSKYEMSMKMRELIESNAEKELKNAEEERKITNEGMTTDPLLGLRVHSWILIQPGSREVEEAFFIEPFTGEIISLNTLMYLGIEAVWNDKNFWVNLQDCSKGIMDMRYDLSSIKDWEFLLPFDCSNGDQNVNVIEMPIFWTLPITLSNAQYDQRYPNFQKKFLYHRASLTLYSPYSQRGNLIKKLIIFSDNERRCPLEEREYFEHRKDKLISRIKDLKNNTIKESFDHGRMGYQLKTHSYATACISQTDEDRSVMEFYAKLRIDGLSKRERNGAVMREWYENRDDRLIYRETHFGRIVRKFGPPIMSLSESQQDMNWSEPKITKKSYKEIERIKERFSRDPNIPADEDIEERIFDIIGNKYQIKYHIAEDCIFPCRRKFNKPIDNGDSRQIIELQPDTHSVFHPKLNPPRKTNAEIYQMLLRLMELEKKVKDIVRNSESEIQSILNLRASEELNPELEVCLWDTIRNQEAYKMRIELEAQAKLELQHKREKELDYLTPYLDMLDMKVDQLTAEDCKSLIEVCENDLRTRLEKQLTQLQTRYETEKQEFEHKKQLFQGGTQNSLGEEEKSYLEYCKNTLVRLNTLENLIEEQIKTTPEKIAALQMKLRSDQRLSQYSENVTQQSAVKP